MNIVRKIGRKFLLLFLPELEVLNRDYFWDDLIIVFDDSSKGKNVILYPKYQIRNSRIGDYSYIARNALINNTEIGKFCSIGPNFLCGWGIHPKNGLSTSPMFFSTKKQNGISFCNEDKIIENKQISIGNDVFIGMNVTVIDGFSVGAGAIIGAGAVVSKDIPPYAIAVGCPIKIIGYRFNDIEINKLLKIKWWEFDDNKLHDVEKYFWKVDEFIDKHFNS
jgi:virginiamycin A acetyltransferase